MATAASSDSGWIGWRRRVTTLSRPDRSECACGTSTGVARRRPSTCSWMPRTRSRGRAAGRANRTRPGRIRRALGVAAGRWRTSCDGVLLGSADGAISLVVDGATREVSFRDADPGVPRGFVVRARSRRPVRGRVRRHGSGGGWTDAEPQPDACFDGHAASRGYAHAFRSDTDTFPDGWPRADTACGGARRAADPVQPSCCAAGGAARSAVEALNGCCNVRSSFAGRRISRRARWSNCAWIATARRLRLKVPRREACIPLDRLRCLQAPASARQRCGSRRHCSGR